MEEERLRKELEIEDLRIKVLHRQQERQNLETQIDN